MNCVILFRWDSGRVGFVCDDDERPFEFANVDDAVAEIDKSQLLLGRDVQIVELDEI